MGRRVRPPIKAIDGYFMATCVLCCAVASVYVVLPIKHRFAASVWTCSDLQVSPVKQDNEDRVQNTLARPESYRECVDS